MAVRVLVADDDVFSASVLEALLVGAGHECVRVADGREAWAVLQSPEAPRIAFLDWMMPEVDGLELCRRIRERPGAEYVYVAILSARNKQRDITLGFQAGADDFITKPYHGDEVLARLRVAERVLRSTGPGHGLRRAIAEASASGGGDVIVRCQHRVGRIIFQGGRIAWAHVSDEPGSLVAILSGEPDISPYDIRGVIEECSVTGENFADVLVAWGLISQERLRAILRTWIRSKIATIAAFTAPEVIFSPEARAASGGLFFELAEVVPPELLQAAPVAASGLRGAPGGPAVPKLGEALTQRIRVSLDRAIAIDGARSAAIFDLRGGQCLDVRGGWLDLDLVRSKLRLASLSDLWDDLEDIMISTRRHIYLLRPYSKDPPCSIVLAVDRATPLGMARRALAECAGA